MEDTQANIRPTNEALKALLLRATPEPGRNPTAIEGVYCYRIPLAARIDCISESAAGLIVQGDKRAIVADENF